jgi:hypothetical protein
MVRFSSSTTLRICTLSRFMIQYSFNVLPSIHPSPTLGVSLCTSSVPVGFSGDIRWLKCARNVRGVQSKENGCNNIPLIQNQCMAPKRIEPGAGIDRGSVTIHLFGGYSGE